MSGQVRVEDLEVLRLVRAALLKFKEAAELALSNADSQIARTHSWLESEQATYWQAQLRKRAEAVTRAREAVRQKKYYRDSSGRTPSAVEEEKVLAQCLRALEQAEEKVRAIRKWLPQVEKEADSYHGGVARLGGTVSVEVPKAVALLDRLTASLEAYVQIEASAGGLSEAPAGAEAPMSRGGDAEAPKPNDAPPAATGPGGAASPGQAPASKEGRDVADGK